MINLENLCMACMQDTEGYDICPNCGMDNTLPSEDIQPPIALKLRTQLQGRYIIGKATELNSEYTSYMGYDTVSEIAVVIREFMPANLCTRANDDVNIVVNTSAMDTFNVLKNKYLNFNRKLASMRSISSIFPIFDIFQENNTAYVVSEFIDSIDLNEYIERSGGCIDWNSAQTLFMPLLSSLSRLCEHGIHHYGINPQNLVISKTGKMFLRGFSLSEIRKVGSPLKAQLFHGYTAPEQYAASEHLDESSDIYGFVSSLFFALTGQIPRDARKRKSDGKFIVSTEVIRNIPPHVITAIANGMQIDRRIRTRKFEHLRAELSLSPTVNLNPYHLEEERYGKNKNHSDSFVEKKTKLSLPLTILLLVLVAFLAFSVAYLVFTSNSSNKQSDEPLISSSSSVVSRSIANEVDVPNLVGSKFEQSKSYGEAQGNYQVKLSSEDFSDTVPEGSIISQTPEYIVGKKITKGSVIAVVVSKGPNKRTLPSVAGKSLADASAELTKNGFIPQKSSEEYSTSYEEGIVIDYEIYKAGQSLEYGSTVNIIVSKGNTKTPSTFSASE